MCASRQSAFSFCQEVSCEAAGEGSSPSKRAMKIRQAERFLKRIRKYTAEEKTLKNEDEKKEHDSAADYLTARLFGLAADRRAAEIFVPGITVPNKVSGKPLKIWVLSKSIFQCIRAIL